MNTTGVDPEYDGVTLKHRSLTDFERDRIIADHATTITFIAFKELEFNWEPGQNNPRIEALTSYLNNMFVRANRGNRVFEYTHIQDLYDANEREWKTSPIPIFTLTALGAMTYATFKIRGEQPGLLSDYVCQDSQALQAA